MRSVSICGVLNDRIINIHGSEIYASNLLPFYEDCFQAELGVARCVYIKVVDFLRLKRYL